MKKTRLVGLLLVLVLVTSCFAGGTFAKYTSQASGADTAVVAKWAFNVNDVNTNIAKTEEFTFDLFNTVNGGDSTDGNTADDAQVKDAVTGANPIIAPGTSGSFKIKLTNKSEVDANYTISLSETANTSNIPIEYSVDGSTWVTATNVEGEPNATGCLNYEGGTEDNKTITVHWRWAFTGTNSTNFTATQTDTTDTKLGVDAAENITAPSITVTATIKVEQVD